MQALNIPWHLSKFVLSLARQASSYGLRNRSRTVCEEIPFGLPVGLNPFESVHSSKLLKYFGNKSLIVNAMSY